MGTFEKVSYKSAQHSGEGEILTIYFEGCPNFIWRFAFEKAHVTDIVLDSSGDYKELDLGKSKIYDNCIVQKFSSPEKARRLAKEFIERVKKAIEIANAASLAHQNEEKIQAAQDKAKAEETAKRLAEWNKDLK